MESGGDPRSLQAVTKPVNVLARPGLSMAEILDAGAQRITVGGSLTRTGQRPLAAAASEILEHSDFASLGTSPPLHDWFA